MVGVELVKSKKTKEPAPELVTRVFEETKLRHVLIGKGGLYGNVLRLGPPMIADKSHVDELVAALDAGFEAATA
jgi:4-aminobutyrate aminotransferase-like enzyme